MTDDDYPSPEQWAEMRRNGHVCAACKTRVWPAPAAVRDGTALSEDERRTLEDASRMLLTIDGCKNDPTTQEQFDTFEFEGALSLSEELAAIIDRLSGGIHASARR